MVGLADGGEREGEGALAASYLVSLGPGRFCECYHTHCVAPSVQYPLLVACHRVFGRRVCVLQTSGVHTHVYTPDEILVYIRRTRILIFSFISV